MKARMLLFVVGATLMQVTSGLAQEIHEDMQIRSWWWVIEPWNLTDTGSSPVNGKFIPYANHPVNDTFNIIGTNTYIYSDDHEQIFNFTRLSGHASNAKGGHQYKSGGTSQVFQYCANGDCEKGLYFSWNRVVCSRILGVGACAEPGAPMKGFDNFFFGDVDTDLKYNLPFSSWTVDRGVSKLDYVCVGTCPAPTYNVLWIKLGAWDMTDDPPGKGVELASAYGINPDEVLDLQAAIHSDEGTGDWYGIEVDNFEHMGKRGEGARGRGGILWYGLGCGDPTNCGLNPLDSEVKMWPGWIDHDYGDNRGSYVGHTYGGSRTYESTAKNRGWLKVEYTGAVTSEPVPYAMKTRAIEIGSWDMSTDLDKNLDFEDVGIAVDRVTGVSVTIRTDWESCGFNCWPGVMFTNFHRSAHNSGTKLGGFSDAGGFAVVEEVDGTTSRIRISQSDNGNFYDNSSYSSTSYNRGFVKIDYLAGACEEGPEGFRIGAIPGVYEQRGLCAESDPGDPFVIEGSGKGFGSGSAGDSLTYVSKSASSGDLFTVVRVDDVESYWDGGAGIMFREENSGAQSTHISLLVNAHYIYVVKRYGYSSDTVGAGYNYPTPFWLAMKYDSNTSEYQAMHMEATGTETSPPDPDDTGWSSIGSPEYVYFGYYDEKQVGLFVQKHGDPTTMESVEFSQFYENWDP